MYVCMHVYVMCAYMYVNIIDVISSSASNVIDYQALSSLSQTFCLFFIRLFCN